MSGKPPAKPVSLVNAYSQLKGTEDLRSLMKKAKDQRAPTLASQTARANPPPAAAAAAAAAAASQLPKPAPPSSQKLPEPTGTDSLKRKAPAAALVSYGGDDSDEDGNEAGSLPPPAEKKARHEDGQPPSGLPPGFFDSKPSSDSLSSSSTPSQVAPISTATISLPSGLPEGFFDSSKPPATAAAAGEKEAAVPESAIPKGFFDDRKKDAEARQTKEDDELGEEWAKFQKEIKKEEQTSTAVRDEDIAEMLLERDQREISEMEQLWTTVERLERQRENLEKLRCARLAQKAQEQAKAKAQEHEDGDEDEDEDDDGKELVDDFMNWRSKGAAATKAKQTATVAGTKKTK